MVADAGLLEALRSEGIRDVDDSALARSLYASDASLYRIAPQVVVRPRTTDELVATLAVARGTGTPLTMRGAGTSIAGNAVGAGIVVDTARHLHRVLELDAEARTARVQPGVVHAALQRQALAAGLRFGPDPSTHSRCTIGGMIGNNACGSRALGYGRTVDNVESLTVLLADGSVVSTSSSSWAPDSLASLVDEHLGVVRTEFGRFGRQVSGYSFEHLLPENGRRLDRFLVGTEGTLGVVLEATVRLVEDAPARALAVLGYADMATAADAVPDLLGHGLVACEGLGERIVAMVPGAPQLPRGGGWIFAEVTGGSVAEVAASAEGVARASGVPHQVVVDPAQQRALWRIREDGAGLAARSLARPAQAGWEDAAVPPDRLGDYLRDFDRLLREHRLDGVPYGHFGDGCVHVRIDFELEDRAGRATYRRFVEQAAELVASYGGSMSGEHGDGRARSELLPKMYSPAAIALMEQAKRILDPHDLLNPGVLVDPARFDDDLRLAAPSRPVRPVLRMAHDERVLLERRAPVHRRRQVRGRQHRVRRGDVPVVPRHPRGEGLHPRTGARAPGRRDRTARLRRPRGGRRARPLPVLQGMRARLPDRHRHGHLQVRGAPSALRPQAPAPLALRARAAAAVGTPDAAAAGQPGAAQPDARPARQVGSGRRPAAGTAPASPSARCAEPLRRWPPTSTCGCGPTRSPTGSPPTPAGRRSSCSRWRACARRSSPRRPAAD